MQIVFFFKCMFTQADSFGCRLVRCDSHDITALLGSETLYNELTFFHNFFSAGRVSKNKTDEAASALRTDSNKHVEKGGTCTAQYWYLRTELDYIL